MTKWSKRGAVVLSLLLFATAIQPHPNFPISHLFEHSADYRIRQWTMSDSGGYMSLSYLWSTMAKEVDGEFVTCPVPQFLAHYMPFAPSDEVVDKFVEENLKAKDLDAVLRKQRGRLVFKSFRTAPTRKGCKKSAAYMPLLDIANAISKYKSFRGEPTTFYYHCPDKRIFSAGRSITNRIDACFRLQKENRFHVTNIAVSITHKLDVREAYRNNIQLVLMNAHTTNDDPRRKFMFGITFEGGKGTLWYQCRSHSAVSHSFDFVKDPKVLIKVFMAFLFATQEELGYDSKITRSELRGNGSYSYIYHIPVKETNEIRHYRTERLLFFHPTNNVTGRMGRVWLVREVDQLGRTRSDSRKCVLKDVWLKRDADIESKILASIFADIEAFFEPRAVPLDADMQKIHDQLLPLVTDGSYKKYFMTILNEYVGEFSHSTAPGSVPQRNLFEEPTRSASEGLVSCHSTGTSTQSIPSQSATTTGIIPCEYLPRKQYRVVFEEVCNDLEQVETLGKAFTALFQVHTALKLLFVGGWVHRDISCGNIMLYEANGTYQVKLSDLEYANKYPPKAGVLGAAARTGKGKTGTAMFMAHEILTGYPMYISPISDLLSFSNPDSVIATYPELIVHNFQHDLESIWWMVLYMLITRSKHTGCHQYADALFGNSGFGSDRYSWFLFGNRHTSLGEIVDPSLSDIARMVDLLRLQLLRHYAQRQRDGNVGKPETYAQIMLVFDDFWSSVQQNRNTWNKIELINRRPGEAAILKRTNSSSSSAEHSKNAKRARR